MLQISPEKSKLDIEMGKLCAGYIPDRYNERGCIEKKIASVLLLAGVKELELSAYGWAGEPLDEKGLLLDRCSLVAKPYIGYENKRPPFIGIQSLLILVMERCGRRACGGSDMKTWMQASWCEPCNEIPKVNGPLVCLYFRKLKELQERRIAQAG